MPVNSVAQLPIFSFGFRPFFLGGAIWAALNMLLWTAMLSGHISPATPYGPFSWHAHELVVGYVSAIMAGFILTAIPNWTGRTPVRGIALIILFTVWVGGRIAMWFADTIGLTAAAIVDSLFLFALTAVSFREIIAGKNRRNLIITVIFGLFAATNVWFHVEVIVYGYPVFSLRAGLAIVVTLIALIGGRIIPNFTRNWLVKQDCKDLPTPFNRFDALATVISAFSLVQWVAAPTGLMTALFLFASAILQGARLARWSGFQTISEPLLFILHVGFCFVPLGFFAVGSSIIWPQIVPQGVALHVWSTGAVGVMTLAVMTRASRGHTGRPLTASHVTQLIYLLAVLAALSRLTTILFPELTLTLLEIAALAWVGAFATFAISYAPMLVRRPEDA